MLAVKDLRIEARSRQTIGLVVVLGILIVAVLGLGLSQGTDGRPGRHGRPVGGVPVQRGSLF